MTDMYQSPCTITPELVSLVAEILQTSGRLSARAESACQARLRRVGPAKGGCWEVMESS